MTTSKTDGDSTNDVAEKNDPINYFSHKVAKASFLTALMGASLAMSAGLIGIITGFSQRHKSPRIELVNRREFITLRDGANDKLAKLQKDFDNLDSRLNEILKNTDDSETATQIAALRADVGGTGKRMDSLEQALIDNPTKALSVPLLRQDLENLKENYQQDLSAYAKQIDRVYDQNKWFIGLMVTMVIGLFGLAISLIGLAISNFIQTRKKNDE